MILSFKDQFIEKVVLGEKIHTIREDNRNRWKEGMKIHFWKSNPRNVKNDPFQFALGKVTRIQEILIANKDGISNVYVDHKLLNQEEFKKLVANDGFDNSLLFWKWFDKDFKGRLIHFKLESMASWAY